MAALISSSLILVDKEESNTIKNNLLISSTLIESIATSTTASMTAAGIGAVTSDNLIIYNINSSTKSKSLLVAATGQLKGEKKLQN